MKRLNTIISLMVVALLAGCSCDLNKDLMTELKTSNNTLTYSEAYLQVNDQKVTTNEFEIGTILKLSVDSVSGFEILDSLVYPGASMQVIDNHGAAIMDYKDLFRQYDSTGVNITDAEYLSLSLTIGDPMKTGETYHLKMRFWDKKGKGEINAEIDIKVK